MLEISRCSLPFWSIYASFILFCILMTFLAVRIARYEQNILVQVESPLVGKSDIRYDQTGDMWTLLLVGAIGGLVAGALGLGGGSIYNPALLAMGIPPKVSSSTGLYLVTFSTLAASVVNYMNNNLDLGYGFWIGFWSIVGMLIGQIFTASYIKRTGRQSIIVWVLALFFVASVVMLPIFGGVSLMKQAKEGKDIFAFKDMCRSAF